MQRIHRAVGEADGDRAIAQLEARVLLEAGPRLTRIRLWRKMQHHILLLSELIHQAELAATSIDGAIKGGRSPFDDAEVDNDEIHALSVRLQELSGVTNFVLQTMKKRSSDFDDDQDANGLFADVSRLNPPGGGISQIADKRSVALITQAWALQADHNAALKGRALPENTMPRLNSQAKKRLIRVVENISQALQILEGDWLECPL